MAYWIASSNRTNWDIIRKEMIWGIPKRNMHLYSRVNVGDKMMLFVRQEGKLESKIPSAIVGAFEITKKFESNERFFSPLPHMVNEVFPYRFNLQVTKLFIPDLEFKPLIPDLHFITNKNKWTGHLRAAMRQIPEIDYQYILEKSSNNN